MNVMNMPKLFKAMIFSLSLITLISCSAKQKPIVLPSDRVLKQIEVNNGTVKVWSLDAQGKKVSAPVESIHNNFAADASYFLEIRDELKMCSESKGDEKSN